MACLRAHSRPQIGQQGRDITVPPPAAHSDAPSACGCMLSSRSALPQDERIDRHIQCLYRIARDGVFSRYCSLRYLTLKRGMLPSVGISTTDRRDRKIQNARTGQCGRAALRNGWPVLAMHRRYPGRGRRAIRCLWFAVAAMSGHPPQLPPRLAVESHVCLLWAGRGMSRDGHINIRKPGQWATGKMAQMVGHRCVTLYSVFCADGVVIQDNALCIAALATIAEIAARPAAVEALPCAQRRCRPL